MKCAYALIIYCALLSCNQNYNSKSKEDSPLIVVVKLIAAESFKDYESAKQLIDLERVYGEIAKENGKSAETIWKEFIDFNYAIGSTREFTNTFPFHKYNILVSEKGNRAIISLQNKKHTQLKEIKYTLELKSNNWVVIQINYAH